MDNNKYIIIANNDNGYSVGVTFVDSIIDTGDEATVFATLQDAFNAREKLKVIDAHMVDATIIKLKEHNDGK